MVQRYIDHLWTKLDMDPSQQPALDYDMSLFKNGRQWYMAKCQKYKIIGYTWQKWAYSILKMMHKNNVVVPVFLQRLRSETLNFKMAAILIILAVIIINTYNCHHHFPLESMKMLNYCLYQYYWYHLLIIKVSFKSKMDGNSRWPPIYITIIIFLVDIHFITKNF